MPVIEEIRAPNVDTYWSGSFGASNTGAQKTETQI